MSKSNWMAIVVAGCLAAVVGCTAPSVPPKKAETESPGRDERRAVPEPSKEAPSAPAPTAATTPAPPKAPMEPAAPTAKEPTPAAKESAAVAKAPVQEPPRPAPKEEAPPKAPQTAPKAAPPAVAAVQPKTPKTSPAAGYDPVQENLALIGKMKVGPLDWPQWAGTGLRNNTPQGKNIPTQWDIETGKNIKWKVKLGSQTYGNPVVANGKVYVGTNNGGGYLARYPFAVDLGCLLCFEEKTGKFLWQHSSEKLPTGRVHDWPEQGICSAPYAEGDRLWFVSSRGEVVCLDTDGFHDGQNDGPFTTETNENKDEADVVWTLDMMGQLGISQHNMCSCSVTVGNGLLFVNTSNGVDDDHINIPAPNAPTFVALELDTGKVVWTDRSPGTNILHGQWSSPAFAVLGGVPQVLFGAGDGWLYSFLAERTPDGKAQLLWKFDCNPKTSKYELSGRATRNHLIGTPVIFEGLVYIAVGEDPEHGEGNGHLWCINPTKRGDVSPELAVHEKDPSKPLPHRRLQAVIEYAPVFEADEDGSGNVAKLQEGLDDGKLSAPLRVEFAKAGLELPEKVQLVREGAAEEEKRWTLAARIADQETKFRITANRFELGVFRKTGEAAIPNPNSAAVWHYTGGDVDGDGKVAFEEEMHRTCGSATIKNGLLLITDLSGIVHCLDLRSGKPHWTHDLLSESWGSALVVEDKIYAGDADGDLVIFRLAPKKEVIGELFMENSIYTTPVVANNVLYIANRLNLFAIEANGP